MFGTKPAQTKDVVEADGHAEINIFTVASGLLYEVNSSRVSSGLVADHLKRFASIMILSVLRNTKSTVKFWFIENFLSPSFLASPTIPRAVPAP